MAVYGCAWPTVTFCDLLSGVSLQNKYPLQFGEVIGAPELVRIAAVVNLYRCPWLLIVFCDPLSDVSLQNKDPLQFGETIGAPELVVRKLLGDFAVKESDVAGRVSRTQQCKHLLNLEVVHTGLRQLLGDLP